TASPRFSPDGKLLAEQFPCSMKIGQVRVSDVETGRLVLRLDHGSRSHVTAFAFSSDSTRIAAASCRRERGTWINTWWEVSGSTEVRVWDLRNQQVVGTIAAFNGTIYQLAFSPGDQLLATVTRRNNPDTRKSTGEVKLWDAKTWKELRSVPGTSVAFGPNGT